MSVVRCDVALKKTNVDVEIEPKFHAEKANWDSE